MKLRSKSTTLATALAATVMFQTYTLSAFANSADTPDDGIAWTSLLMPTVLILAAAVAATFVLKRWKGAVGGRNGPLQLIHVIALGPRERLALVKVGARYLVVGITPNNVNRIAELYDIQHAGADSPPEHPDGDPTDAGV
jgi:flagellar biosynthetic protein FliO